MSWNYRVVEITRLGETYYEIREAYYDDKKEKKDGKEHINSITLDAIAPRGSSLEALKNDIGYMLKAIEKSILKETDF